MRGRSEGDCELSDATDAETLTASEAELDGKIAMREALSGVAALPENQRQAMFLTAVGGQSHDEVASALGISDGAVRGLLYRARATLRSAAAAITPQPLIDWASGGAGTSVPTAERVAELSSAGGAFGATGLLIKGAVVAVTAGALATGAAAVHLHQHNARRSAGRAPSAQVTRSAATDESPATHVASTSSPPSTATVTRSSGTLGRAGDGARRSGRRFAAAGETPAGRRLSADRSYGVASNDRHDGAHGGAGRKADSTGGEGGERSPGSPSHDGKHSRGVNTEGSGSVPAGSHADGGSVQSPRGNGSSGESAGQDAHGEPGQAITADEHSGKRSASGSDG
jgi:Sigma-70, region 4